MPEKIVEIDVKKTKAGLADGKDIDAVLNNVADELEEELQEADATLNLAALGAQYSIGPLDVSITLGNLVLLNQVVPEIMEINTGGEVSFDTCVKTLFVLAKGKEAVSSVTEIEQRIQDMYMPKTLVNDNPDLFQALMDRVELISQSRVTFVEEAKDFYLEHFVLEDFEGVLNKCIQIIDDAFMASKDVSDIQEKNTVKKKV